MGPNLTDPAIKEHEEALDTPLELPVREWLTEMDIGTWRLLFDASPGELGDLLVFTRARDVRITSRAFAGEVAEIPIVLEASPDAVPGSAISLSGGRWGCRQAWTPAACCPGQG